jgi:hypothetical protein
MASFVTKFVYFNSKKLGFDMPFDKLKTKHIANLIQSNPITCVPYNGHHMKCFRKLRMKDDISLKPLLDTFFVTKFQDHGSMNMIMDFYGLQMPQHMVWTSIK